MSDAERVVNDTDEMIQMLCCNTVGNPRLEHMLRSLMIHRQPERLLEAAAGGDVDTVRAELAHLPPLPNVRLS